MKKEELYKRIMENVTKELGRALNEDFQFDDTEVADKLLELVKKDKQIQNIVKNANPNDWSNVIRGMVKLVKSGNIPENPEKIANIVQLAAAILNRGFDSKLQEKLKEMTFDDYEYTSKFLVNEIQKAYGDKKGGNTPQNGDQKKDEKGQQLVDNKNEKNEGENCQGKNCNEKNNDNKPVSEARNWRPGTGKFSKYLNENRRNIRPGRK